MKIRGILGVASIAIILLMSGAPAQSNEGSGGGNGGGAGGGNGGGAAEHHFVFAYQNLERYLTYCLESPAVCTLSEKERRFLTNIRASLPVERKQELQFPKASEASFLIDGLPRLARTGKSVGSPILINSAMLYPEGKPLGVASAVGYLVHELGHHHEREKDHAWLDRLGSKVELLLMRTSQSIERKINGEGQAPLTASTLVVRGAQSDQLIVTQGDLFVSLTELLASQVQCSGSEKPGTSLRLSNLHWSDGDSKGELPGPVLGVWYSMECPGDSTPTQYGSLEVSLPLNLNGQVQTLIKERIILTQKACAVYPYINAQWKECGF